jgi:signal transduction histidine kinase
MVGHAQNSTIDSLKKILKLQSEDTNKVNTLIKLTDTYITLYDYTNALPYAKQAVSLAEKLKFKRGLIPAFNRMGIIHQQHDYTGALRWFTLQLEICRETDNKHGMTGAYTFIGDIQSRVSNWEEAIKNIDSGLIIAKKYNYKIHLGNLYYTLGMHYGMKGNYSEALRNYYSTLKIAEEIHDKQFIADCFYSLAEVHSWQGAHSEALKYGNASLKLSKEINDRWRTANACNIVGWQYSRLGKYQEALQQFFTALKLWQDLKAAGGDNSGIRYSYNSIGNIYEEQAEVAKSSGDEIDALKKLKHAKENYLNALNEIGEGDPATRALNYLDLGNVEIKLNNIPDANKYLEKGLQFAISIKSKENIKTGYSRLAQLDSLQGNFKDAYEHYKLFTLYRDSLVNEESTRKSVESKIAYEFDKKEAVTKAEQSRNDAEVRRTKKMQVLVTTSLSVLVLAILVIALMQYKNSRQKQKANLLLQNKNQTIENTLSELQSTQTQLIQSAKLASLGELSAGVAHEIQNPLNFVNNFSDVNSELIAEMKQEIEKGNMEQVKAIADDIAENEEKISHHGKRADAIVKGMLQHSRVSSGKKELTNLNALAEEYLRLSYHGMRAKDNRFNVTFKTEFDENIGGVNVIPQDFGRVLLNLYNNAFYSVLEKKKLLNGTFEPTVCVSTKKFEHKVELSIKDNGTGIPEKVVDKIYQPFFTTKPTGQGTGLGLSLSYEIVKAHGGEINMESKEGEYANFIIVLPLVI